MKPIITALLLLIAGGSTAQELYVYTDPASNLPAKSLGFRLTNNFMQVNNSDRYRFVTAPELMLGISKTVMVKAEAAFSNMSGNMKLNGGSLYAKYRFHSSDEVHSHFRMAAYLRGSLSNLHIHQPAIDLLLMNSGTETGIVATKLNKRVALSASVAHLYAADNTNGNKFSFGDKSRHAAGYTVSVGRLMLPGEYTSYDQTNVNLMLELLGQTNLHSGKTFADLAPSVQFIIKSRMRVDAGYRFAIADDLYRTSKNGFLLRLEYNIFNAF
ncbi:MAG: hypothetical protein QM687_14915 [Ferruginibacter sp.]